MVMLSIKDSVVMGKFSKSSVVVFNRLVVVVEKIVLVIDDDVTGKTGSLFTNKPSKLLLW